MLKVSASTATPTDLIAHDEFDQTEGNLDAPKALPFGGNWAEASKTGENGFKVISAVHNAQRAKVSDASLVAGCYALAGTEEPTTAKVSIDTVTSNGLNTEEVARRGVFLRYTDTNNWLMAALQSLDPFHQLLVVVKRVSGTTAILGSSLVNIYMTTQVRVALQAGADGSWSAWAYRTSEAEQSPRLTGRDAVLATGEALAKGKAGFYDAQTSATACIRYYDNFTLFTGVANDAAVFAGQSAEVRSDRVEREDSGGTLWVPRYGYKGSYFKPPPARREARTLRTIVKLSRGPGDADPAIDDVSFRIYWQARGLVLPEG